MNDVLVAKSYQELPKIGDVFTSNNKKYINVQLKSGKLKTVRVYNEAEYKKMYPTETPIKNHKNDPYYKTQKEVLGFKNNYITIFKGNTEPYKDWFRKSICRCTRLWGWYVPSTEEIPADLPKGLAPVRLEWSLVGKDDEVLKSDLEVQEVVDSLIYADSASNFVGSVGERLELILKVDKVFDLEKSVMHIMSDEENNVFIWTTASKYWEVGSKRHIKATLKEHTKYKNTKRNILTRCMEIK